jgi:hypothetical protein
MLEKLIIFVEEYSMEVALEYLLPKALNNLEFSIFRFQCKDDLIKNLPDRLKAYSAWLPGKRSAPPGSAGVSPSRWPGWPR